MSLTSVLVLGGGFILNAAFIFWIYQQISSKQNKQESEFQEKFEQNHIAINTLQENTKLQAEQQNEVSKNLLALITDFKEFNHQQRESAAKAQTKLDGIAQSEEKLQRTVSENFKNTTDTISTNMRDLSSLQKDQLNTFATNLKEFGEQTTVNLKNLNEGQRQDLNTMRETVQTNIKNLQDDNNKKLEQMRLTVDEKLQSTLEKRISISFKEVSERLEQVHKGLGEMQSLATGVGDLKKVLTNVKTRGTWGEVQLANLLEQIMSPEQYQENVQMKKGSAERVDFAIKLPGDEDSGEPVWLPLDSKFPQEDYARLLEAQESGNPEAAEAAAKQLDNRIKIEAKSIKDKYIDPPNTTDFALLFLPTEGLYAEIIRKSDMVERIQRELRVCIVGPTTLAAFLNSLQLGFRTLTIQKRSSEVWKLLAEIKKHFGSFGDLLEKAHDKISQASKTIDDASRRSRTIETKLRKVQELPVDQQVKLETSSVYN